VVRAKAVAASASRLRGLDVLRLAVEPAAFARRRINVQSRNLVGDHDPRRECAPAASPSSSSLVQGAVGLGSIKQSDAEGPWGTANERGDASRPLSGGLAVRLK